MAEKTLVLKVRVEVPTERILSDYSKSCSRWLNTAFHLLYADKRNHRSKVYGGIVTPRTKKDGTPTGKFWTDDTAVYRKLVSAKDAPQPIPTDIAHKKNVQALSKKLVTVWGGFLGPSKNRAVPRPRGHLPRFRPACYIGQQQAKLENDGMTVSFPYPLSQGRKKGEHRRVSIELVPSPNPKYKVRLDAFRQRMKKTQKSGSLTAPSFEIRKHEDGEWYLHVPVEDARPQATSAGKAIGVDLGERNTATTALVAGDKGERLVTTRIYRGLSTRHALDLITARRRKLRRKLDRGSRGTRMALERIRGKMARINDTLAHQASAAIVKTATQEGVSLIALEDLRSGFRPLHKRGEETGVRTYGIRKWNHRLGRWNRGAVRDDLTYKAKASGIQVKEVFARGTSSQCPNCHPTGWLSEGEAKRGRRSRKGHVFQCKTCGYSRNDDETGAINIARRGLNPRPKKATHDPNPGSDAEGGGSGARKGTRRGHLPAPETTRRGGKKVATGNGAFLDRNEKGTTGTGGSAQAGWPATSPQSAKVQSVEEDSGQKPKRLANEMPGGDTQEQRQGSKGSSASAGVPTPAPGPSRNGVKLPKARLAERESSGQNRGLSKSAPPQRRAITPAVAMAGDLGGHGRLITVEGMIILRCRNGWRPGRMFRERLREDSPKT